MLIAIVGHIDHGKTSLVRVLTGVDTDRLPEERARGISIDLGFAYWRPGAGETIGFVDVPGHERFVRNMLAGVGAVDVALIVVAADDGVMPQSIEHVQILDLLGVRRGIVAITKCDRSPRERIDEVRDQVGALLAPTALAGAPVFEVSATTGVGIADLAAALLAAREATPVRLAAGRNFRMPIDRVFSVTGVGVVVTGTVMDGALETGARLVLSPRGLEVRVRGLQSAGQAVERIKAGERCALNLAGLEVAQAHRGDWLVTADMHAPTTRLEAKLKVLASKGEPLKHHAPVHLHLGAADIPARVLIPRQASIAPGGEAVVQLALDHPTLAATGDRFVLRDHAGRASIGGGRVIDPFVTADRRSQANRAPIAQALQASDAAQALAALLAIPGHEVDTVRFEQSFNLESGAALELYRQAGAVVLGGASGLALPAERIDRIGSEVVQLLTGFHREHPETGGMTVRELKAGLQTPVSPEAFLALQKELAEKRLIATIGSVVKLAGHSAMLSAADTLLWRRLVQSLEERGVLAFTVSEAVDEVRSNEVAVKALLFHMRGNGEVWRITDKRFVLRSQIAALAATAAELTHEVGGKGFTAAQYRDAVGAGRTLAIQILEFFDRVGVTYRNGDLRKIRHDYALLVGSAAPYAPRA